MGFDILIHLWYYMYKYLNDIWVLVLKTLIGFNMKHIVRPLETIWYYVASCGCYFPYIEHHPKGILLDGKSHGVPPFVIPVDGCRLATYEEVVLFHNR